MSTRSLTRRTFSVADPEPFASMNITPLIDVLLVLLVMMILTIPAMMNEIPVDLPQPGPAKDMPRNVHRIDLAASGALTLDGQPIADAALPASLSAIRADPQSELQIKADAQARYDRFDQTLATIKRAGITRLGFVGNDRFADFGDGETAR